MLSPDIVYIDTSVFISENFFAPGNRINSLAKLAKEGKVRLVMPEITRQEVIKHIKSAVRQSWKAFNNESRVFRNNPEVDAWRKGTDEKQEIEKILDLFEKFLADSHVKILDYSYCDNAEKVFTDYFGHRKPFGEGQKKDEFPDAFVLTSLEKYSKEINQHVVVLSADGDMEGYESKRLDYEDYGQYVSKKVIEGVALDEMARSLLNEKMNLEQELKDAAVDYLDDFRLYQTLLDVAEVTYHSINEVKVEINEVDYEVISVNDKYIEVEIQPEVKFKVEVDYVNYDSAVYDKEDGQWYGTEDDTYVVYSSAVIPTILRYYYGHQQTVNHLEIDDIDLSPLSDAIA